jgi:flagellar hook-length control protein FliK
LSLGHADVGQHDRGDQTGQRGHGDEAAAIDEVAGPSKVTPLTQLGLVDAFA